MSKRVHDSILDAALNEIKTKSDLMTVCSHEPENYTAANFGGETCLAGVDMDIADFTIGNGDISGRRCSVAQKSGVNVDQTGTANHVALLDTVNSNLLYVTTCTDIALTEGSSLTLNGWDVEIGDPS